MSGVDAAHDARFMDVALGLGKRGLGRCWPNPAVGCVVVNDGRIVGRGWTQPGGRPHAETQALDRSGAQARGATAYVTLEPCAHTGQTPPCARALIEAGVARVVVALRDPDPRVDGGGVAMLRAAGVEVTEGVAEDAAARAHAGFLMRVKHGRPWVTLKLASSFDGRIATASGESRWITGAAARRQVHGERAVNDAVLIGGGTARDDDPSLTVRGFGVATQPIRIVLSSALNLPTDGVLARTAREVPVWLLHTSKASQDDVSRWAELGAECMCIDGEGNSVAAAEALRELGARGLTRVFCEGGGTLAATLLRAGLVDELVGFTAGVALGADARPSLANMGLTHLADAPRFRLLESRVIAGDILHRWEREPASPKAR